MLNITSIGTVVPSATYCGTMFGKPIIYPDGYTIERSVFAPPEAEAHALKPVFTYKASTGTWAATTSGELHFTATIRWVSGRPTFSITRSDNPAEKTYTDGKSATSAWRKAFEDAVKDFPARQVELAAPMDPKHKLRVNGIRLYCLHLKEVCDELLALPGGRVAFEAAAAASCAAPASSAVAVVASEIDARSTSLRSASGSQPLSQERTQRHRATSPMPKSCTKAPAEALGSARSSKRRATPSRCASVAKDASPSASVVSVGTAANIGGEPLAEGEGVGSTKKRRARQPKGVDKAAATAASTPAISGEAAGSMAAAPVKRQRTSSNKRGQEAPGAPSAVPPRLDVVVVCPECGLSGTTFCAATGKLHLPPPCMTCGLTTAFCPVTGHPHHVAAHRENRQRGEVHLPGAARRPRRRVAKQPPDMQAAALLDDEVTVVAAQGGGSGAAVVVGEGEEGASKKTRRRRLRVEDATTQAPGNGADATEKPTRARRARKVKDGAVSATQSSETLAERAEAAKGDAAAGSCTAVVLEGAPARVEEQAYMYPPLRPPLTIREHHKAAHLLQESWRAQYGDGPVLPAAVAAVPLALVSVKRIAAAVANRRRKGRGEAAGGASGEEVRQSDDDEGGEENGGATVKGGGDNGDDDKDTAKSGLSSAVGTPASTAAAALPVSTMVHPLEVTQMATSVAGKRLSRFLVQYTSERTLFDLLKSSSATGDSGAGRKAPKRPAEPTLAGGNSVDAGAGDKGNWEPHTVVENGDEEHPEGAPGASPSEACSNG
ncbi:hypothetical protein LSCM1_04093 [Leishmania martiniquensis]|uniref:Uncharacterized protein n=1 Tax=Leishmania martiniquensis TaxID=1580590 RepID=A0A836KMV9_9TRYP|nr:hypothetical protein LSCM1_04093 [Leishmania martiniquensis]